MQVAGLLGWPEEATTAARKGEVGEMAGPSAAVWEAWAPFHLE